MTIRRYTLLAVGPLLFALRGNQDLIVRTNVQMVEVSIVATDAKGKSAAGLEAKDIRVWDNGKEQTIASFRSVSSANTFRDGCAPARYLFQPDRRCQPDR